MVSLPVLLVRITDLQTHGAPLPPPRPSQAPPVSTLCAGCALPLSCTSHVAVCHRPVSRPSRAVSLRLAGYPSFPVWIRLWPCTSRAERYLAGAHQGRTEALLSKAAGVGVRRASRLGQTPCSDFITSEPFHESLRILFSSAFPSLSLPVRSLPSDHGLGGVPAACSWVTPGTRGSRWSSRAQGGQPGEVSPQQGVLTHRAFCVENLLGKVCRHQQ